MKIHIRGCPALSHTAGMYWNKNKAICTCPPRVYKSKRKPVSVAWDNANARPDLGRTAGQDGCYVQHIRRTDDK